MRHAVFLAPVGRFANHERLLDVARAAEAHGWDGLFMWDHTLRRETAEVLDPWVMLGALAAATERLRLGPIARRRLIKLARKIVTVDVMSKAVSPWGSWPAATRASRSEGRVVTRGFPARDGRR